MLKRLQDLSISPHEISSLPNSTRSCANESFIPFVNERDSLGRLIRGSPKKSEMKSSLVSLKEISLSPTKKQLLSQIYADSRKAISTRDSLMPTRLTFETWVTF